MKRHLVAAVAALLTLSLAAFASAPVDAAPAQKVDLIVVLQTNADVDASANEAARATGGTVGHRYSHALKGFSISVPAQAADRIANLPNVAYIEADQEVSIAAQDTPTGIRRIDADSNAAIDIDGTDDYRVNVDVAVIDTGVDWEHPDLNVVDGIDCSSRRGCRGNGDDDHYHGTHVAGTVAAIDNGIGVVGVAPGARIHAVKVLTSSGSGTLSGVVAGIDWVAARAGTIEVANMSLGGYGYSQTEYDAIQGAVNAGVAFAVAAGNDSDYASNYSPAAFDNVLTVSALADFNGEPGGGAASTCRSDEDDTLANFSNFGNAVDIAAPGVCIHSTYPLEKGNYGTISGTSMASPHAAGGLALLASADNPNSASDVHALYSQLIGLGNTNWTDEFDGHTEKLMNVASVTPAMIAGSGGGGGGGGSATFTTSSSSQGKNWTATITYSGEAGSSVTGTWSTGKTGGCTIAAASSSCSFSESAAKKTSTLRWTSSDGTVVSISR